MLLYDALNMRFRELKLRKDPQARPITELVQTDWTCQVPEQVPSDESFGRITVREFSDRRQAGWQPFVLDVRKPHEAQIVSLDFVDALEPHETIGNLVETLPRDRDIVIHCKTGGRSAKAASTLAGHGFTRLFNLEGGILGWAREVDQELPTY